ncbi:MAG TPA: putative metal-binding motif-containing protein, partial [Myxococcota bacterium]|nr:putative metal-binding motif-containing protein [Myxococcota bacterium]
MLLLLLLSCDPEPSKESVDRDGDGVESPSDCDDGAAGVRPGAPEYCNGVDDNCDGAVDEQALDATLSYADRDGDGYGDPATGAPTCDLPAGFVVDATDCSDADATISPVGTEVCGDTLDQDCSGADLACPAWTGSWGADELEALRIEGVTEGGHFGFGLEGGDFNGDGAGDLLVGDGEWAYESRRGLIIGYAGPFVAGSRTADQQAGLWIPNGHPDFEGSFGSHLEKVGDLNLDGSEDFMAVLDYGDYSSVFSGWGAYHYYDALDNRDCSSAAPLPHRGTAPAWACGRPYGGARGGSVTVHAMDNEHVVESYGATTTGDRAGTAVAG